MFYDGRAKSQKPVLLSFPNGGPTSTDKTTEEELPRTERVLLFGEEKSPYKNS